MADKLISFPPVLPDNPKVLILGSMPGGVSLQKHEYYGNRRNHFWPILFELFQQTPLEHYEEKITFVKEKQIALWDTIGACYREGSLDSNIKAAEPNDIKSLLVRYPSIKLVACNGTKSYQMFCKYFQANELGVKVLKLPSTSPIPGRYTKTFAGKLEAWQEIMDFL